ncbi:stalk domain-containing protein [Paenibacillus sp. tmac-D7]|uniref:stalk domain-containing protein n=1 Tax=Paenibacillus sp. tmac-D7 TaxID=2591462 RepID=UPI0015E86165|nr:stalk domain-containing protein [Paenibacillus sp. tmac-D7]
MKREAIITTTMLLCGVFTIGTITGVSAETNLKEIAAYINQSINIKLNGNQFIPTDREGNKLSPIIYNGDSYLPVRSLSQALGVAVKYDDTTSTIMLGEPEGKGEKLVNFRAGGSSTAVTSRDADILSIHGETINEGFYSLKPHDILPSTLNFRLNAKYQKLSFRVGVVGSPATIVVSDQKSKVELKKFTVSESDQMKQVEIGSIGDVDYLDINIYGSMDSKRTTPTTEKVVITDAFVK